jgi:intracellular multiplication protein IcmL
MDFVNWRRSIQELRVNFTARGHAEFLKALEASNNLETVRKKKHIVTAKTRGVTRIINQGPMTVKSGWFKDTQRYRWDLQIPIQLLYENSL